MTDYFIDFAELDQPAPAVTVTERPATAEPRIQTGRRTVDTTEAPTTRRGGTTRFSSTRVGVTPGNKGKTYPAQPLDDDEVLALIARCGTHPAGIRDRALIALLFRGGLRVACEALRLLPGDLDRKAGTVFVRCGKGGKSRTVPLDPWAWQHIDAWLELRGRYPTGPVFCVVEGRTKGRKAMSESSFRQKLHDLAADAGITKRVHPHGLRHSLACQLMAEGFELSYIQLVLGHSSPATTGIYLRGMPVGPLFERIKARPAPGANTEEEA